MPNVVGSIENEALENEDRSTKHPNLEANDHTLFWEITFRSFRSLAIFKTRNGESRNRNEERGTDNL